MFLLPDDSGPGELETLLKKIAVNGDVADCMDSLRKCLQAKSAAYALPKEKDEVYAYCQARGIETAAAKRQYASEHWDFTSAALEPLKTFLTKRLQ